MFVNKERIENDLEIFKRSLALDTKPPKKNAQESEARIDDAKEKLTFSEFISLCGAAFYVIFPWALVFAALMGLVGWLMTLWLN